LPENYTKQQADILNAFTKKECDVLLKKYFPLNQMQYVVVGDASKILDKIKGLGMEVEMIKEDEKILN
jgi:hypothetical protein